MRVYGWCIAAFVESSVLQSELKKKPKPKTWWHKNLNEFVLTTPMRDLLLFIKNLPDPIRWAVTRRREKCGNKVMRWKTHQNEENNICWCLNQKWIKRALWSRFFLQQPNERISTNCSDCLFVCMCSMIVKVRLNIEWTYNEKLVAGDSHNASMHHKNAIKMSYQKHKSYYIHIIKPFL